MTPENKTKFCRSYPHYCNDFMNWDNFKVPKLEFYDFEENVTLQDLKNLGHEKETFIEDMTAMNDESDNNEDNPVSDDTEDLPDFDNIQGPHLFFKNLETAFACYSLHSRVNNELDPHLLKFFPLGGLPLLQIILNFESNETFIPGREPGGLLAIHSPFEMINPYDAGIALYPGKIYKIHLKLEEEELLPHPYQSCVNYTQMWLDRGRTGPRSQEMCKQFCLTDIVLRVCNCSLKFLNIPHDENTCFTDGKCITKMGSEEEEKATHCVEEECKEDCQKYKFRYDVQERKIEGFYWPGGSEVTESRSAIQIYATDPEVVVYKYRPHYQDIEVFSYIGGYIGAWLGISLIAVADFFECLFRIATFAIKRRKKERENKEAVSSPL